jgi:ribonuclease HII
MDGLSTTSDLVGGLDEVGFGAWAGPIISVVAVFDEKTRGLLPSGVTDSKKTTEKKRASAFPLLIRACKDVGVGHAWPWEIDGMGVTWALQTSYERALNELSHYPQKLIVDGTNRVKVYHGEQVVEPKADLNHLEVSVASMIAKHMRDQMMIDYAKQWPMYHFDKNKGYGSHDHEEAIKKHGILADPNAKTNYLHRRLYCRKVLIRGA